MAKLKAKKKKLSKKKKKPDKLVDGRNLKGQFKKGFTGNPTGGRSGFMDEFHLAMRTVEKAKRKTLLQLFVERAYEDNRVLVSVVDRMLPSLKAIETLNLTSGMDDATAKAIQERIRARFEKGS